MILTHTRDSFESLVMLIQSQREILLQFELLFSQVFCFCFPTFSFDFDHFYVYLNKKALKRFVR